MAPASNRASSGAPRRSRVSVPSHTASAHPKHAHTIAYGRPSGAAGIAPVAHGSAIAQRATAEPAWRRTITKIDSRKR